MDNENNEDDIKRNKPVSFGNRIMDYLKFYKDSFIVIFTIIGGLWVFFIFMNKEVTNKPVSKEEAKWIISGSSLLEYSRRKNSKNYSDKKSNDFLKQTATNIYQRISYDKSAKTELKSLENNDLEIVIKYYEKQIEKTNNDIDLLFDLLVELAALNYFNNNLENSLQLYKTVNEKLIKNTNSNFPVKQTSNVLHLIQRIELLIKLDLTETQKEPVLIGGMLEGLYEFTSYVGLRLELKDGKESFDYLDLKIYKNGKFQFPSIKPNQNYKVKVIANPIFPPKNCTIEGKAKGYIETKDIFWIRIVCTDR